MLQFLILALGGAAGFGYGFVTRQSVLGVPVPLEVLTSESPLDAPFREELISHLAVCVATGFAISLVVVLFAALIQKRGAL